MNRKLMAISVMTLVCSLLLSAVSFSAAEVIPNPDQIIQVTIGMPETVDPHWAYDTASAELIQNVYEPLCFFDRDRADAFISAIADWWPGYGTVSGNGIAPIKPGWNGSVETWLFRIRTNVPWQNASYGTVTTKDVEYSFERAMLFDRTSGPSWMFYEPLLGKQTSYDYDLDGDGTLNATEYMTLDRAIDNAIQSNATHVWFNMYQAYSPFQQILSQTWSDIMCKQWCKDQGLWNGQHGNYTEFLRTWDPVEPGPLMEQEDAVGPVYPGPVAMGTGPYKLKAYNPDPHTGWYTLEKFDNYWRGWPAPGYMYTDGNAAQGYAKLVTVKCVEEWSNRKAQFFSTDPALQADINTVPRSNCPELHVNGNKDGDTLPGFRLIKIAQPLLYAMYFQFEVKPTSDSIPLLGNTPKTNLFSDRNLRLAFSYCFNYSQFIHDVYLGEATQSPIFMPAGTAYFNGSKPAYDINIAKATEYFKKAWGGQVWSEGITVKIAYNTGNVMRQVTAEILEYYIENLVQWPAGVKVDIQPTAVPWSIMLPGTVNGMYPTFIVGWLADFPDPHNWAVPFVHPSGTYAGRQKVDYSLDPAGLKESWSKGATYGPPPYTNALGETVTAINNTYIAHLIDVSVGQAPEKRHLLYEELMDIYYAEATQLPFCFAIVRHYERSWIQGFARTYNIQSLAPGSFFYTMWKGTYTPAPPAALSSANVLQGSSVSVSAAFVDPASNKPAAGLVAFVQQSLDNATWSNVVAAITDANGFVNASVVTPLGVAYYRVKSPGYLESDLSPAAVLSAKYYEDKIASGELTPVFWTAVGPSLKVTTRTLDSVLTEALTSVATKSDVGSLTTEISNLKSAVNSLTTYVYVSIGVALVALLAAVFAFSKKKTPSAD